MMTFRQLLLIKVAEECAEIAQRALKQAQFGRDEVQPGQELTNGWRLIGELTDLEAVVEMCQDNAVLPMPSHADFVKAKADKKAKIVKYLELSVSLGQVAPKPVVDMQ